MWWYLLPSIIAATIGAFLTWIQHTQEDSYVFDKDNYDAFHAQVLSSYNIHFPKFIEWFWLDINIHMPHHVSTRIPWYSLKACLNDIRDKRPDCIKEERFTFKMIGRNLKMIHLSKMESHSFWQLTPKKGNH